MATASISPISRRWTWPAAAAFAAVLALIAACRWEIVDSLPYWDAATALFVEADFLAETKFDYRRLLREEPYVLDYYSGPRSYMTSILPTFLAGLMSVCPSTRGVRVGYHLFVFCCASFSAVAVYHLLDERYSRRVRLLTTAAATTSPIFAVQMDLMGMDMPTTAAALACAWLFVRERYVASALASLLAYAMKPTGLAAAASGAVVVALRIVVDHGDASGRKIHQQLWGLTCFLAVLIVEGAVTSWGGTFTRMLRSRSPHLGWTLLWCPDLAILFVAFIVAFLWIAWKSKLRSGVAESSDEFLFSLVMVFGSLAAITRVPFLPRYLTIVIPFFFIAAAWAARRLGLSEGWATAFATLLIGWNLANWNGALLPDQAWGMRAWYGLANPPVREGSFLERSHEYLAEHRRTIRAVEAAANGVGEGVVLAGHPFDYCLALPRLGYVAAPVRVCSLNGLSKAAPAAVEVERLPDLNPRDPVMVRATTTYSFESRFELPPPAAGDQVLFQEGDPAPTVVYRSRAIQELRDGPQRRAWYESRLWPGGSLARRVHHLIQAEAVGEAIEELQTLAKARPDRLEVQWILWGLTAGAGSPTHPPEFTEIDDLLDSPEALLAALHANLRDRYSRDVLSELAAIVPASNGLDKAAATCLREGWTWPAAQFFRLKALRKTADSGGANRWSNLLARGDLTAIYSTRELNGSLQALAVCRLQQGRPADAARLLETIVKLNPRSFEDRRLLGIAYAKLGRSKDAIEQLTAADQLAPNDQAVQRQLQSLRRLNEESSKSPRSGL